MIWNIYFEVAAGIIVAIILVHFNYSKSFNSLQYKIFSVFITVSLISIVMNLVSIYTIIKAKEIPLWLNYFVNCGYLLAVSSLPAIQYSYFLFAIKEKSEITWKNKVCLLFPILLSAILIGITPFWKGVIYFNENMEYVHGDGMHVLYAVALFYLVLSFDIFIRYRKVLTSSQITSLYFYILVMAVAVSVQLFQPKLLISGFMSAMSCIIIYFSLQNPFENMDKYVGTFNRESFIKTVENRVTYKHEFIVLGLQIEGFQLINEALGIANSDLLLKQVTEDLMRIVPKEKVFHVHGVQFALIMEYDRDRADEVMKEITERFNRPFRYNRMNIDLSVVMCCLSYPHNVKTLEDVIAIIDYSFGESRKDNKESIIYASEDILDKIKRRVGIERIMEKALKKGEFQVYYQPIINVEKGGVTCAEALVRLYDEEYGFISPDEFIPMAEKKGSILQIGEAIFTSVCRFASEMKPWQYEIEYIEVNLSVVQCMQEDLHKKLLEIMDRFRIDHVFLNFEITETAAIVSKDKLLLNMKELIKAGGSFALDDYGTGFSNTENIINFPFKLVKIDKEIIWLSMKNKKAFITLEYMVKMLKSLNIEIVAEGVETLEQAEKLQELGIDFFQGFYFSKPVSEESFMEFIRKNYQEKLFVDMRREQFV
jgi:EAL domain-containing protein (putative c-di-GMP-specific phosphodiesterase class I)/GGDEF domain-containing protein